MAETYLQTVLLTGLTPTWDSNKFVFARILQPVGNVSISLLSNGKRAGILLFQQDAGGGRTLTITTEAGTTNVNGASIVVDPAPNSYTQIEFVHHFGGVIKFKCDYGTGGTGNTTPAAPTVTGNDTANTLDFYHALGDSEIEVSVNNAAPIAMTSVPGWNATTGVIDIGNIAVAAGYYRGRIKAATGRNVSAYASSPAFTVAVINTIDDTFTGSTANLTTHEPEAGGAISKAFGSTGNLILVGDGTIRIDSEALAAHYTYASVLAGADQSCYINMKKVAASADVEYMSIMLRADTSIAQTGYEFRIINVGTSSINCDLYLFNNGAATSLATQATSVFNDFAYHNVDFSSIGSTHTLKINGITIFSFVDATLPGTTSQRKLIIKAYTAKVGGVGSFLINTLTAN